MRIPASVLRCQRFFRHCRHSIRDHGHPSHPPSWIRRSPTRMANDDNKRLGTANWRVTRAVSVSRPVVFQRDYEATMQIRRGMRRVKYAAGCKRLHREVRQDRLSECVPAGIIPHERNFARGVIILQFIHGDRPTYVTL